MTEQHKISIITRTMKRMAAASHLPADLVTLLGQTGFCRSVPDPLPAPLNIMKVPDGFKGILSQVTQRDRVKVV